MSARRRVLIVRHGETEWNAEGRWQGWRDIPLSDRGREQAAQLGRRLAGQAFELVASSSLSRARETAEIATGSAPHVVDERLREISYGDWEGQRDVDVWQHSPELRETWDVTPDRAGTPSGETLHDVMARAWPAFTSLLDAAAGDVLIVAHGGVNRLLLGRLLGRPLSAFWHLSQDPTAVNVVELPAGPAADALPLARVCLINCTAHLL